LRLPFGGVVRNPRRTGAVLLLLSMLAACGGDDSADSVVTTAALNPPTPAPTSPPASPVPGTSAPATHVPGTQPATPTTAPQTLIEVADERLAFTLALPDEHAVVNSGEHDLTGDGSCVAPLWQLAGGINIESWPASCDPANSEPGNGTFGHYRTAVDAPRPVDPIEVDTVLGPAEVFGQTYFECTNSCDEWELDIAVITLSEPVNDDYPTLTVIGTVESYTRDDLLALLESFGAG
jgi:hypothetical protein